MHYASGGDSGRAGKKDGEEEEEERKRKRGILKAREIFTISVYIM